MDEFTPYEDQVIMWNALVKAVGAVKAKHILDREKLEYAMIRNSSNIEVR